MKNILTVAIILVLQSFIGLKAQNTGEELFKTACASCHTIGKGRLVGPDLTGVYNKRSTEWLIEFIRSSQSMIKSGDPDAVAIFEEYNRVPMPDNPFNDEQISGIIDYIKSADQPSPVSGPADTLAVADSGAVAPDTAPAVYTFEMVAYGDSLFRGTARFLNGSIPCISCHNIMGRNFLGGGRLAIDLDTSYSRLGHAGVQAILTNPPFPAMRAAMPGALTDEELESLLALLQTVNQKSPLYTTPTKGGLSFFMIGFVIAILLLAHIYILYDHRMIPDTSPGAAINHNKSIS